MFQRVGALDELGAAESHDGRGGTASAGPSAATGNRGHVESEDDLVVAVADKLDGVVRGMGVFQEMLGAGAGRGVGVHAAGRRADNGAAGDAECDVQTAVGGGAGDMVGDVADAGGGDHVHVGHAVGDGHARARERIGDGHGVTVIDNVDVVGRHGLSALNVTLSMLTN